ncbi:MAG: DUF4365 domain-containing protein [Chloroflexi bacterium]|nr:DUF4365 domain-containing protein [Chloroflexota bacterium]
MTIPSKHREEELNLSYLQSVATIAGFTFEGTRQDYGIDGHFRGIGQMPDGRYYPKSYILNFQAKATTEAVKLHDGIHISYEMEAKYYNKLAYMNCNNSSACLLIVLALPSDESKWVRFRENALLMSGCCYWGIIKQESANSSKVAVRMLRSNQFNPISLTKLYQDVKDGKL